MQSNNSFGSYYPVESIIHKLNPSSKLINFILCIITLILTNNTYINIFMFSLVTLIMLLSHVPIKYYLKTLLSLRYIYIILFIICYYLNKNITSSLIYILKLITIVEYINTLSYTSSPSETIYSIEKIFSKINFLYLPLNKIAFKINKSLRYFPSRIITKQKFIKALTNKGVNYYESNIIKRIYINFKTRKTLHYINKQKNNQIDEYSKYKLFNIKKHRTNYKINKISLYDIAFTLFHILIILCYIKIRGI